MIHKEEGYFFYCFDKEGIGIKALPVNLTVQGGHLLRSFNFQLTIKPYNHTARAGVLCSVARRTYIR